MLRDGKEEQLLDTESKKDTCRKQTTEEFEQEEERLLKVYFGHSPTTARHNKLTLLMISTKYLVAFLNTPSLRLSKSMTCVKYRNS